MKVALCCIGRTENQYAIEFVEWYKNLGFDKIFVYDNKHKTLFMARSRTMMEHKAKIIAVSGKGGVGKDTLCAAIAEKYRVMNVSSVDPIKEIARGFGWNGEKDCLRFRSISG